MKETTTMRLRWLHVITAALLVLASGSLLAAVPGMLLAQTLITATTITDVQELWRKEQGMLFLGYNFTTMEYRRLQRFPELRLNASGREMSFPVDLFEEAGVGMLPDGGVETTPISVSAKDAFVSFVHANKRFNITKRSRWASRSDGGRGVIVQQIRYQGRKAVEALGRTVGYQVYGYSTGVSAKIQADPGGAGASHTIVLKDAFGSALIPGAAAGGTAAQSKYIAEQFKKNDVVALFRGGNIVTNAVGRITAEPNSVTPSIAVTWLRGNIDPAADDEVVIANSMAAIDTSVTLTEAHTNYQRTLVGLLEMNLAASVHSLATATAANWSNARTNATTGRFTGLDWRQMIDDIQDFGDEDATPTTWLSRGVHRDLIDQYSVGLRFDDAFNLEINGDVKANRRPLRGTRRCPPGMVFMFDQDGVRKKAITDFPQNGPPWDDAKEMPHQSVYVFGTEWAGLMATPSRKLLAIAYNKDES